MKVKVLIKTEMEAKVTYTRGRNAYVVALRSGGLMEDPEVYYSDYQIIRADTEYEAKKKYDELNHCEFFYGEVLGKVIEGDK